MDKFYLLSVDFLDNRSKKFESKNTPDLKTQIGHLFIRKSDITLKLLFTEETHTSEAFIRWLNKINILKLGEHLNVSLIKNSNNQRLLKVDLSESNLLNYIFDIINYSENLPTIELKFDRIKLYWEPSEEKTYIGEYYLNNSGFRLVNEYYNSLYPNSLTENDGKYEIPRKVDKTQFYKLLGSNFRPEFNFVHKDGFESNKAIIYKEPKIQFKFDTDIDEAKAIYYGNVFLMLASFYYHVKIDYVFQRIYLPEHIITVHKIEEEIFFDTRATLLGLGNHWDFDQFLQANWQNKTLENYELLSRAITLFNHSHTVDNKTASKFLLLYNILEVFNKQKKEKAKFKSILSNKERKIRFENALEILLETIDKTEHKAFIRRWSSIQNLIMEKPMKGQLETFLQSQKIDLGSSSISIRDINKMRNKIIHGDTSGVDYDLLRKINLLLYRISGILILNFMGISNWEFDTNVN